MSITFLRRLLRSGRKNRLHQRLPPRPQVEALEDRFLLSLYTWNWKAGNANSNWSDPNNWLVNNQVPATYPGQNGWQKGGANNDSVKFDGTSDSNCTLDVANGVILDSFTISQGHESIVTLSNPLTVEAGGAQGSFGSTIAGSSTFTIDNLTGLQPSFSWTAGTWRVNEVDIAKGASLAMSDIYDKSDFGRAIYNSGTVLWSGSGNFRLEGIGQNNTIFWNLQGATFNDQANNSATIRGAAGSAFWNFGTFNDTSGNITNLNVAYLNTGTVSVSQGSVLVFQDDTVSQQVNSQIFYKYTVDSACQLIFMPVDGGNATYKFYSGGSITGKGFADLYGGTFQVLGWLPIDNFIQLDPGVVAVTGTLAINGDAHGTYDWEGGPIQGSGAIYIGMDGDMLIPNGGVIAGPQLQNDGSIVWSGGDITVSGGGEIVNDLSGFANNTAVFECQSDNQILNGGGAGKFYNNWEGFLIKSGGTGRTYILIPTDTLNWNGTTESFEGVGKIQFFRMWFNFGAVNLQGAGLICDSGLDLGSGSIELGGTNTSVTVSGNYDESGGTLAMQGGTVTITGDFDQTGGTTTVSGSLTVQGALNETGGVITDTTGSSTITVEGGDFTIAQGATLNGYGTITVQGSVDNYGLIDINSGQYYGSITITGNYTQGSGGILDLYLFSAQSGDSLIISGTATLGGTLNVAAENGYTPTPGNMFTLLRYMSASGGFGAIHLPTVSGGHWMIRQDPGDFQIVAMMG
jgi:hypothetical protein